MNVPDQDGLIGDIYECVLEPGLWPDVLARIVRAVGGKAGWIAVHYPRQIDSVYRIESGTDPEQQQRLRAHYLASSPFIGAVHYVKRADVISVADVIDYDEFVRGRFYREWAGPQGWPDFIMGVLTREADRFTWLGVCMGERARDEHKERVALFLPHIERAVRISDLLDLRTTQAADLTAMAAALATGMILVDEYGGVRGVNPAAERLIDQVPGLAIADGRLRIPAGAAGSALREAITACAAGAMAQAGATVLLPMAGGHPDLVLQVLPLPRSHVSRHGNAIAALFLTDPARAADVASEPLAARFGLTPSEIRVALALLDGSPPREIADRHGVSIATVRTHLRRLYDKTGTSGQAALVKLVASATRGV